jgi:hypothetical protein
MKYVKVIQNVGENEEIETTFSYEVMPMAIHFAECWAKRNGYKLVKSPAKIAQLFPACHRVAVNKDEKIFYAL